MGSSILRIGLIGLVIITLLGTLAWLFRMEAADWLVTRELARQGYPEASLDVTTLSLQGTTLRNIELTPERGPAADRVAISHSLGTLLRRDFAGMDVEIRGLRLDLAGDAEAVPAGDDPVIADGGPLERLAPVARFARVAVMNGRVAGIPTPAGPWQLDFDGTLHGGADGLRRAELTGVAGATQHDIEFDITARHEADTLHAGIAYSARGGGLQSHTDLRISPPLDDPYTEIFHSTRIDGDRGPAPDWWPLPWPTTGTLEVTSGQSGRIGPPTVPSGVGELLERLTAGEWGGQWTVEGEDLGLAERIDGVRLEAGGDVRIDAEHVQFRTDDRGAASIEAMTPAMAARLPLPEELAQALTIAPARIVWPASPVLELADDGGLVARLTPDFTLSHADTATRIRLAGTGEWRPDAGLQVRDFRGEIENLDSERLRIARLSINGEMPGEGGRVRVDADLPRVQLEPLTAEDVTAQLDFNVIREPDTPPRLQIANPGRISAGALAWEPALRSMSRVEAEVTGGTLQPGRDAAWDLELAVEPAEWRADLFNDTPLRMRTTAHDARLSGPSPLFPLARATLENIDAQLDEPAMVAEGVDLDLRPGRIEGWLRFAIASLRIDGGPLPLAPLRVRGQVDDWSDEGQRLHGQGSMADERARLTFLGRLPRDDGNPRLQIDWDELAFAAGGLQPADLSPAVPAGLRDVSGSVNANLALRLAGDGLDGEARLRGDDLDFRVGLARVHGLRGTIAIAGIRPWRTDGNQRLDAEALELGLRLQQPRMRFAIEPRPGRGSVIALREAAADYAGDRLFMPGWTLDPNTSTHDFDIEVGAIDLATLVADLGIPDLEAEGRVSGQIPVALIDGRIIIRDASLGGPDGRLAFRPGTIDEREPEIARAFTNLDYERLNVTLNQHLERDDVIDIAARGRNPDVRGGEQSTYSIRLHGDVEALIQAILRGEAMSSADVDRYLDATAP
jgi:hypothetical protein